MCDSDYPLAPKNYRIENTCWKSQYVSVGHEGIVGYKHLIGGTQTWKLEYKDGYATFQGVPPYPAEGKYIAVDWSRRVLVYSETPGLFQLESVGGVDKDVFVVKPLLLEDAEEVPIGWELQNGKDGSPVRIATVMVEGAQWRFT